MKKINFFIRQVFAAPKPEQFAVPKKQSQQGG